MMNPLRTGLITTLLEMGARIEALEPTRSKAARTSPTCACARASYAASTCRVARRPR